MAFSIAPLLMFNDAVPKEARLALKAAYRGPAERRQAELELAARVLHRETDLDCRDALDLVGLPALAGCG